MKQVNLKIHGFNAILVLFLLFGNSSTIFAKNKDCWADFFDKGQYKGEHFRLQGPSKLKNLLDINGGNWDLRIHSLIVGPKANVTVFENKNFKLTLTEMAKYPVLMKSLGISKQDILEESELIFYTNSKIHDLGDFNFHHKIRSIKIECVK
jgi:beta/gamma crystallin